MGYHLSSMPQPSWNYSSPNLTLTTKLNRNLIRFHFTMLHPVVNTKDLPQTTKLLKKHCPSVLSTKCNNALNLPFKEEVKATEVAHLFEHIILQQMCQEQIKEGYYSAEFSGRTIWETAAHPLRIFTIETSITRFHLPFLRPALKKSLALIELILDSGQNQS